MDSNVLEGTVPTYDGPNPAKASDAQYSYIWNGWTPEVVAANKDATYTATYQQETRNYTVTWKNYDGTVLKTDENVPYGTTPSYSGVDPVKASTAQYDYSFDKWTPEITSVSGNAIYTASFKEETRKYTITWKNHDGSTIKTEQVPYGQTPTYEGDNPTKTSDTEHDYFFSGWSPSVVAVEADAEYTATFEAQARKYTITWKNHDGSVIKTEEVPYGSTPSYTGDTPEKASTNKFAYVFEGWSPEILPVTGPAEYIATFREELRTYTITWKNYDGTVLEVDENVPYGTTPTYDGDEPVRPNKRGVTYTFIGWDYVVSPVWDNKTYTAMFSEKVAFSFEPIEYEMKQGYQLSDLQGAPWVNSNLEGQLNKIKKPSLKDDFYASVNYDRILNNNGGAFNVCDSYVNNALNAIYANADTTNGAFYRAVYNKIASGDISHLSSYVNSIDAETYLSSKDVFNTHLILVPQENGYEVQYNDGYMNGDYGIQTIWFYSRFDGYESLSSYGYSIVSLLADSLGFTLSTSDQTTLRTVEGNLGVTAYNDYYNYYGESDDYTVNTVPWSQMKSALLDAGLSGNTKITISKAFNNCFTYLFNTYLSTYPDAIKNSILTRVAFENRFSLGAADYRDINQHMNSTGLFPNERNLNYTDDTTLARILANVSLYIIMEQSYIELQGSEEVKAQISTLIEDVLNEYHNLIDSLEWLSSSGKTKVKTKLDYMQYASCYSDAYKNFAKVNDTNLNSTPLFNLYQRYSQAKIASAIAGNYENTGLWGLNGMPSYTVNAFYSPTDNSFVILNGVVRGMLGNSVEEMYGMIGTVIGHEITHAFDSSGSQFDENGRYNANWLPSTDKAAFTNKVKALKSFVGKIKLYNDTTIDGDRVNGEATADMGGVKIMLALAKKIENFDYDKFFKAYAYLWCSVPYSNYQMSYLVQDQDSHPLHYIRANLTLAQFDEFIETYDIGPGDAMYIPENQRVKIW